MSMDLLFKSDDRPHISPVVDLKTFLFEASKQEERLHNFFKISSTDVIFKREYIENEATASSSGSAVLPNPVTDAREAFRQFMIQQGNSPIEADDVVAANDDVLTELLENNPINEYEITFPPKDSKLMTHKVLHDIRVQPKSSAIKNAMVGRGKYFKYREQELRRGYTDPGIRAQKDVVLTVHLLKPLNRTPESLESLNLKHRCEVKMLIRGSMPLVRFRDKIFCASDFWANRQDFEPYPEAGDAFFRNLFPSNFLFIHDTFYVDKRHENSKDISEPIREFMKRKHREFGEYHVKDMTEVRVIDLKLRLGQPYLYFHQGICEHLLYFTDLRLLNAGDVQNPKDYPIRLFDVIPQKACSVCNSEVATFVVTESDRLPHSPAFFCAKCFCSFHYAGKERVGNFRAYHYLSHSGIE